MSHTRFLQLSSPTASEVASSEVLATSKVKFAPLAAQVNSSLEQLNFTLRAKRAKLHCEQSEQLHRERRNPMKLIFSALTKCIMGLVLIGALLFLPAWTLHYPGAWLFIALLFIPMLLMGIVLFVKAPALLEKRLNNKEKEKTQQGVVSLAGLMFPIGFVLSALDFRFCWSSVSLWLVIVASVLFLVGYGMYAEVMRENAYLSRTVEVQENQTVISTGLYGVVRHPMYLATFLMFLPLPLILGSFWGLIPFALYPAAIVIRILNEEKVLTNGLDGYAEYKTKVKYRLFPFVW